MAERHVWIPVADGVRLAASLYLPDSADPCPVLLEALPYRKDDVTAGYRQEYRRLVEHDDAAPLLRLAAQSIDTGDSGPVAEFSAGLYIAVYCNDYRRPSTWPPSPTTPSRPSPSRSG